MKEDKNGKKKSTNTHIAKIVEESQNNKLKRYDFYYTLTGTAYDELDDSIRRKISQLTDLYFMEHGGKVGLFQKNPKSQVRLIKTGMTIAHLSYLICEAESGRDEFLGLKSLADVTRVIERGSGITDLFVWIAKQYEGFTKNDVGEAVTRLLFASGIKAKINEIRHLNSGLFERMTSRELLCAHVAELRSWIEVIQTFETGRTNTKFRQLFAKTERYKNEKMILYQEKTTVYSILVLLTLKRTELNELSLSDVHEFLDILNKDFKGWKENISHYLENFGVIGVNLRRINSMKEAVSFLALPHNRNIVSIGDYICLDSESRKEFLLCVRMIGSCLEATKDHLIHNTRFTPSTLGNYNYRSDYQDDITILAKKCGTHLYETHPFIVYQMIQANNALAALLTNTLKMRTLAYALAEQNKTIIELLHSHSDEEWFQQAHDRLMRPMTTASALEMYWSSSRSLQSDLTEVIGHHHNTTLQPGIISKRDLHDEVRSLIGKIIDTNSDRDNALLARIVMRYHAHSKFIPNVSLLPVKCVSMLMVVGKNDISDHFYQEIQKIYSWTRYISSPEMEDYIARKVL